MIFVGYMRGLPDPDVFKTAEHGESERALARQIFGLSVDDQIAISEAHGIVGLMPKLCEVWLCDCALAEQEKKNDA
jgi:hypothetical protein